MEPVGGMGGQARNGREQIEAGPGIAVPNREQITGEQTSKAFEK